MADNIVHTTPNNPSKDAQVTPPFNSSGGTEDSASRSKSFTLDALGPVVSESYPVDKSIIEYTSNPSNPVTPGDLFPGAFPKTKGGHLNNLNQDADYVKEAASNALETAKEYIYSASEVVGGYLPTSVAAYFPNNESPRFSQNDSIVSDASSETEPDTHGETLNDAHIPEEDVGISGNRVIEDHSLVTETSAKSKSTASDTSGPTKPEHNTLVPPTTGTISHHKDSNGRDGGATMSSKQLDGASTDASTRTLMGSRADTWSHVTTAANSTSDSHKADMRNTDGTMKTSFSAADTLQHNFDVVKGKEHEIPDEKDDRPEFVHHPEEARHVNAPPVSESTDKSAAPHISSPVTTGREYLTAVENSTKSRSDSKAFAHHDSLGSTVATPGHEGHGQISGKGKEKAANIGDGASNAVLDATETGARAGSVATGIDTSATRPTINNAPTDDTGAWAASVVSGLNNPGVDRIANASNLAPQPTPAGQVNTVGTDGNTPIIEKSLPNTPNGCDGSSANAKTKNVSNTKSKFIDKLRGEIKILSGKLENSQEKIEEGRRLVGKPKMKN